MSFIYKEISLFKSQNPKFFNTLVSKVTRAKLFSSPFLSFVALLALRSSNLWSSELARIDHGVVVKRWGRSTKRRIRSWRRRRRGRSKPRWGQLISLKNFLLFFFFRTNTMKSLARSSCVAFVVLGHLESKPKIHEIFQFLCQFWILLRLKKKNSIFTLKNVLNCKNVACIAARVLRWFHCCFFVGKVTYFHFKYFFFFRFMKLKLTLVIY